MTISFYEDIISMKEAADVEVWNKIVDMGKGKTFLYLWEKFPQNFKQIVFYCLYTYSWESKRLTLNEDLLSLKIRNAQEVGIPKELYPEIIHLKDRSVESTFFFFYRQYNDNDDLKHLLFLQENYLKTTQLISQPPADKDGATTEVDIDKVLKYVEGADKLMIKIELQKEKIKDKYQRVKKADADFEGKDYYSEISVENSKLIK